jgi:hypothetical protein
MCREWIKEFVAYSLWRLQKDYEIINALLSKMGCNLKATIKRLQFPLWVAKLDIFSSYILIGRSILALMPLK